MVSTKVRNIGMLTVCLAVAACLGTASADWVAATVPTGARPNCVAVNPVTNKMYVPNYYDRTVTVIDGATDLIVATVGVGVGPRAFCLNPARNRVYVANASSSSISVIRTSPPGIEESFGLNLKHTRSEVTVVRGVLVLGTVDSRQNTVDRAELLDASGRKVMNLEPGENDVRALAPGVYFLREVLGKTQKVVVTR